MVSKDGLMISVPVQPTEGQLFRDELGTGWDSLADNFRKRFDHDPAPGKPISYCGVMSRVECSLVGKVLAWFVQLTGALMPLEGSDVPVNIAVWTEPGSKAVFKRREYQFPGRQPFRFQSRMLRDPNGRLVEHVGGGFGMYILVREVDRNLHFEDDGYFVEYFGFRIPIPSILGPGRVRLRHEDIAVDAFSITIEITHRLFGPMYFQQGLFRHASTLLV